MKYAVIAFCVYLFVLLPIPCYRMMNVKGMGRELKEYPLLVIQDMVNINAPLLYGNIFTLTAYIQEYNAMKEFKFSQNKALPEGIALSDTTKRISNIYVVIGESSLRDHYSLYGYSLNTTPFLDSLASASPRNIHYYTGITSSPITRDALRMALSFASPMNMQAFFDEKSIIDMANDADYETFWVSNQGTFTVDDTYLGYLAATATNMHFQNQGHMSGHDIEMVPIISEMKKGKEGTPKCFFIHLNGSHNEYVFRYDDIDRAAINSGGGAVVHYDRSIHHTDRVLRGIYQLALQDSSSVVYYFSDHGERVGIGHGWKTGIDQFNIPLIVINNSDVPVDSVVSNYVDPQMLTVNNSSSPFFLATLMGYDIPQRYYGKAIEEGRYVFHTDRSVEPYTDIR